MNNIIKCLGIVQVNDINWFFALKATAQSRLHSKRWDEVDLLLRKPC